jgi:hypothetical protein
MHIILHHSRSHLHAWDAAAGTRSGHVGPDLLDGRAGALPLLDDQGAGIQLRVRAELPGRHGLPDEEGLAEGRGRGPELVPARGADLPVRAPHGVARLLEAQHHVLGHDAEVLAVGAPARVRSGVHGHAPVGVD